MVSHIIFLELYSITKPEKERMLKNQLVFMMSYEPHHEKPAFRIYVKKLISAFVFAT